MGLAPLREACHWPLSVLVQRAAPSVPGTGRCSGPVDHYIGGSQGGVAKPGGSILRSGCEAPAGVEKQGGPSFPAQNGPGLHSKCRCFYNGMFITFYIYWKKKAPEMRMLLSVT